MLAKKNLKLGELMLRWDKDSDGTVTRLEFRKNCLEMGVDAHPRDIDMLFDSLDSDGKPPIGAHAPMCTSTASEAKGEVETYDFPTHCSHHTWPHRWWVARFG